MNSAGSASARMLRIGGPSDLINGAGQLFAAGARQVHGVRQVLQGSQVGLPAPRCAWILTTQTAESYEKKGPRVMFRQGPEARAEAQPGRALQRERICRCSATTCYAEACWDMLTIRCYFIGSFLLVAS